MTYLHRCAKCNENWLLDEKTVKAILDEIERTEKSHGHIGTFKCPRCVKWKQLFSIDLQWFVGTLMVVNTA